MAVPERLRMARWRAAQKWPYLATVIFALVPVEVRGLKEQAQAPILRAVGREDLLEAIREPVMAVTPRGQLLYNPEEMEQYSLEELAFVVAHECWHYLKGHPGQELGMPGCPTCEYVAFWAHEADANQFIEREGIATSFQAGSPVLPSSLGLKTGETAGDYFDELCPPHPHDPCGAPALPDVLKDKGLPQHGGACLVPSVEGDGLSDVEREMLARQVAEALKAIGSLPLGLARWVEQVLSPQVPWQRLLSHLVRTAMTRIALGHRDYTFRKGERRHDDEPFVLPLTHGYMPRVAVVVDTSGSMSERDLSLCLSEVRGILRAVSGPVDVISCDAAVHHVQSAWGRPPRVVYGGGGTDMGVGIEAAVRLQPGPDLVVVMTDGWTPWPEERPQVPVIVVLVGKDASEEVPAWARVVHAR
jgi:hypothetical protein